MMFVLDDQMQMCATRGGGGALPNNGLLGMCCWMGSHFHGGNNYSGVDLLEIFNRVYVTRMGLHF